MYKTNNCQDQQSLPFFILKNTIKANLICSRSQKLLQLKEVYNSTVSENDSVFLILWAEIAKNKQN